MPAKEFKKLPVIEFLFDLSKTAEEVLYLVFSWSHLNKGAYYSDHNNEGYNIPFWSAFFLLKSCQVAYHFSQLLDDKKRDKNITNVTKFMFASLLTGTGLLGAVAGGIFVQSTFLMSYLGYEFAIMFIALMLQRIGYFLQPPQESKERQYDIKTSFAWHELLAMFSLFMMSIGNLLGPRAARVDQHDTVTPNTVLFYFSMSSATLAIIAGLFNIFQKLRYSEYKMHVQNIASSTFTGHQRTDSVAEQSPLLVPNTQIPIIEVVTETTWHLFSCFKYFIDCTTRRNLSTKTVQAVDKEGIVERIEFNNKKNIFSFLHNLNCCRKQESISNNI